MALTPSTMLPLGTLAPHFNLLDVISGQHRSLAQLKADKATVIMFICNHCPYVKHVQTQLVRFANDYQSQGVAVVAINSNDVSRYPEDAPDKMKEVAQQLRYPFPYLFDETQAIAKAYQAACTPDFYLFDSALRCVYRGQFDPSRPGNGIPVTGQDLRQALEATMQGKPVSPSQKASVGCSIKWKA